MLTTYQEIKDHLLGEWDHVTESRLHEYVEFNTPVYYGGIVEEWQQLPGADTDAWKDYGVKITDQTSIYDLMTTDLSIYYQALVERAFEEITEEKESAE